jgi:uncharacterized damage-inducible protein DinB
MSTKKIEFDVWANKLICNEIKQLPEGETRSEIIRLFTHLLKAQVIWFNRVNNINEKVDVWPDDTEEACSSMLNDSHSMLDGIYQKIGEDIEYHDTKGNAYHNSVEDIFDHVIIHGQHHRAQISLILRKAGITPPVTDYIYFLR